MRKGQATKGAFGKSTRGITAGQSRAGHKRIRALMAKGQLEPDALAAAKAASLGGDSAVGRHFARIAVTAERERATKRAVSRRAQARREAR